MNYGRISTTSNDKIVKSVNGKYPVPESKQKTGIKWYLQIKRKTGPLCK